MNPGSGVLEMTLLGGILFGFRNDLVADVGDALNGIPDHY